MGTHDISEGSQSIVLDEMRVEFELDGRQIGVEARAVEQFSPSPQVVFEVANVPREPLDSIETPPAPPTETMKSMPVASEGPSVLRLDNGTALEVVPISWLFNQTEATLHLAKCPSVVFESDSPIARLQFGVLNVSHSVLRLPIALNASPWLLGIEPVQNLSVLEGRLRVSSGYAVTHRGFIEHEEGHGFSREEAELLLDCVDKFLSFACGSSCAVTQVVGISADGSEAWKRWGAHHVAPWHRHRTWIDDTLRGELSEIFGFFWQDYKTRKGDLDRVLGWYVYSNQAPMDVSIILNQAVLELITCLSAGQRTTNTGEWMADNLSREGIDPKIPAYCQELMALADQHHFAHGPHALVEIRNSMVHPTRTLSPISLGAYYEAKQLGLWYSELLMLKRFNHMGMYASRLTPVQRPGDTELVPWAKRVPDQV